MVPIMQVSLIPPNHQVFAWTQMVPIMQVSLIANILLIHWQIGFISLYCYMLYKHALYKLKDVE